MGDLNLLKRNLLSCAQEVISSLRFFRAARSGPQKMKYFPHMHELQQFKEGLKGAACFKISQVILKANLASFKRQMCWHVVKFGLDWICQTWTGFVKHGFVKHGLTRCFSHG